MCNQTTTKTTYEDIDNIVQELHKINFGKTNGILHIHDNYNVTEYLSHLQPISDSNESLTHPVHEKIAGYCTKCKKPACTSEYIEKGFRLNNISHGAHSFDFFTACGIEPNTLQKKIYNNKSWFDTPVLFLMENPSTNKGETNNKLFRIIENDPLGEDAKRPAHHWYWIHNSLKAEYDVNLFNSDTFYIQRSYGKMVFSLIHQYALKNAYLTNIVKCGISNYKNEETTETALNLNDYSDDCKTTCTENILLEEIKKLCTYSNKLLVFAFGKRTYSLAKDFLETIEIQNESKEVIQYCLELLPHPSDYHINNAFRKHILKGIMEETLSNSDTLSYRDTGKTYQTTDDTIANAFNETFSFECSIRNQNRFNKNLASIVVYRKKSSFQNDVLSEIRLNISKNMLYKLYGENKEHSNLSFCYIYSDDTYYWKSSATKNNWIEIKNTDYTQLENLFKEAISKINN